MNTEPLVKVRGLEVAFTGSAPSLHSLNFDLFSGECLGLVGESGSGKSLTAWALMGLLPPQAARKGSIQFQKGGETIELCDQSEAQWRNFRKKEVAMVFQEPMSALNPLIRCGKQVKEGLDGCSREDVLKSFENVLLPEPERIYRSFPHELSGGQRQRVVIAMALLRQAQILIADEPTTALDATVQREILDLLKSLQKKFSFGLLFISHDLDVVRTLCDRLLVLKKGETMESGDCAKVFDHPSSEYTRALIKSSPAHYPNAHRLPGPKELAAEDWKPKPRLTAVPGEEVVELKDIRYRYPGTKKEVLSSVNLQLRTNETYGLVGESGSGKSTLGRIVCGLIKDYSGAFAFQGRSVEWTRETRSKIQMVFQDPFSSLNPRLKVGTAIAEPMIYHGLTRNAAESEPLVAELLEQVGLQKETADRYPFEFSGGQRQRIVMARALASKPKLIVCDESVASLDVQIQAQVLNLLRDLQERHGFSCLFISHDLAVIRFISDRMGVLEKGVIVEEGATQKVLDQPEHLYTRQLVQAVYG